MRNWNWIIYPSLIVNVISSCKVKICIRSCADSSTDHIHTWWMVNGPTPPTSFLSCSLLLMCYKHFRWLLSSNSSLLQLYISSPFHLRLISFAWSTRLGCVEPQLDLKKVTLMYRHLHSISNDMIQIHFFSTWNNSNEWFTSRYK